MAKNNLSQDLAKQTAAFKNLVQNKLPQHAAMQMEEKYHESFEQESNAFKPTGKWASRKPSKKERGQGTLVQSGRLKASAETHINGTQVALNAGYEVGAWNIAEIHNEGLKPVPQRQFMPIPGEESPELSKEIENYLDDKMDKIFG